MVGYHGDAERTAEAMAGGYYHTGDIGARDEDGYITYVGRTDDVFKASDYRISPFELESVLIEHEAVAEAAVVPSPDPLRLAVPKAYVVLAAGWAPTAETAAAIFAYCRAHLAPYQRIRRLEFAELPKTISGKIRRVELRAERAGQARRPATPARPASSGRTTPARKAIDRHNTVGRADPVDCMLLGSREWTLPRFGAEDYLTGEPLRVALLTYRGNPFCGGQGVYVRHLSRELVRLGHRVDVFAGQPYPVLDEGVRLIRVPSLDLYREPDPFRTPKPGEYRDWVDVLEVGHHDDRRLPRADHVLVAHAPAAARSR